MMNLTNYSKELQKLNREQKQQILNSLLNGLILKEDLKHLPLFSLKELPLFIDFKNGYADFLGHKINKEEYDRLMNYYKEIGINQTIF